MFGTWQPACSDSSRTDKLSIGERLEDAQALRVGKGSRHRRTPLPYAVRIANVDHAPNIQQLAQRRNQVA